MFDLWDTCDCKFVSSLDHYKENRGSSYLHGMTSFLRSAILSTSFVKCNMSTQEVSFRTVKDWVNGVDHSPLCISLVHCVLCSWLEFMFGDW